MNDDEKQPFWVHCGKCHHQWAPCFVPIDLEAFGKLTHNRCPACGSRNVLIGEFPKPTGEGDPIRWLTNGDTGTSSETIWGVMMRRPVKRSGWPLDPADFGRCYRLLKVMPSWRARLGEVAGAFPKTPWVALVEHWADIEALYEKELPTGRCPQTYNLMRNLRA